MKVYIFIESTSYNGKALWITCPLEDASYEYNRALGYAQKEHHKPLGRTREVWAIDSWEKRKLLNP